MKELKSILYVIKQVDEINCNVVTTLSDYTIRHLIGMLDPEKPDIKPSFFLSIVSGSRYGVYI